MNFEIKLRVDYNSYIYKQYIVKLRNVINNQYLSIFLV